MTVVGAHVTALPAGGPHDVVSSAGVCPAIRARLERRRAAAAAVVRAAARVLGPAAHRLARVMQRRAHG